MRSDTDIKRDVEAELRFRPHIDERDIAVKMNNAVGALTGFTWTYLDKQRAKDAVERVFGVAGMANDIEARLAGGDGLTDPEITRAAVQAACGDAMTRGPLVLNEHQSVVSAIGSSQARRVRRAPVTDASGMLFGMLSSDDLLAQVSDEPAKLAKLLSCQVR